MMSRPNAIEEKKDLHFGGLGGVRTAPALAAVADPMPEVADSWLQGLKNAADSADEFVRDNPWAAIAVVGVIGLGLGFLLARQN